MASGGNGEGSKTNLYLAWTYECFLDESGQAYETKKHLTSVLPQREEVSSWLSRCIACINSSDEIVIGIAPGSCMVTELDINGFNSDDGEHVSVITNLFQQQQEELQVTRDVTGKVVCILDDIWTTGRTLKACHQLVTKGAKKVCLLAVGETPRFHMVPYHRSYSDYTDTETIIYLKMGTVYDEQRKIMFLGRVFNWVKRCTNYIKTLHPTGEIVLGITPGHTPSSKSFMTAGGPTDLRIVRLQDDRIAVLLNLLQRYKEVEKQATSKKQRTPVTHLNSIEVVGDVAGKVVCILDDVWTSGSTLRACCQLVAEKGAVKVYPLTIGETVR